jgi:hypothetical protein
LNGTYVLNDKHEAVFEEDAAKWSGWMETERNRRRVGETYIGDTRVSTAFLGLDHAFGGGVPMLFETMVFEKNISLESFMERCSTWDEAGVQHVITCIRVLSGDLNR